MKYVIGFSAVFTRKKFWLIMSLKFWNDFTTFDHPVCSNPNKVGHQIYLFYERSSLHPSRSVIVFIWSSFTKNLRVLSMVTKMYIFLMLHPIHPVFLRYIGIQGRKQPHSPGWARVPLSSFFPQIWSIYLIFPQTLLIFFLILVLRVGEPPTREGPGYTIVGIYDIHGK